MKHQIINFYLNKMLNSKNTPLSKDNHSVVIFDDPIKIFEKLVKFIESKNFVVSAKLDFNFYGQYSYDDKTIYYRPCLSPSQKIIVLVHETMHLLHEHAKKEYYTGLDMIQFEIEAVLSALIALCNICTNKMQNYIFDISKGSLLMSYETFGLSFCKSFLFNHALNRHKTIVNTSQYLTKILKDNWYDYLGR